MSLRFLLIDDHDLIVQALNALLHSRFPNASVHTGSTALQARALTEEYGESTDLMILDLGLPDVHDPISLLKELVAQCSAMKILVLSGSTDVNEIQRVLQSGAAGFVPKSLDSAMLTGAIDFVLEGGVYIPTKLLDAAQRKKVFEQTAVKLESNAEPRVRLTDRQVEVLALLARGLPIKSICRELALSEGTVKTHVSAIYKAFGSNNRTQALIAAQRAGFEIKL